MVSKMKSSVADGKEDPGLHPQLWKELPDELVERIITKLPFSSVVAFRTVCKSWYADIIPRAARHVGASSRSVLLYFGFYREKSKGSAWWLELCKSKSGRTGALEEFQPSSFPFPRSGEAIRLVNSQDGLLFFAFVRSIDSMAIGVVACNPLTGRSKILGLPCPLRCSVHSQLSSLLVGVVFDARAEHYSLLAAGVDEIGNRVTFLYDSLTSTWTNGPSMLPALLKVGENAKSMKAVRFSPNRNVLCNGNMYWYTMSSLQVQQRQFVLKFDFQHSTWTLIPFLGGECSDARDPCQIVSYQGEVRLWHLHNRPARDEDTELSPGELFDPTNHVKYPQPTDLPCRLGLDPGLAPEIKLMQHSMIEKIDRFCTLLQMNPGLEYWNYSAFRKQNVIYHVLHLYMGEGERLGQRLKVVAHNTDENTYSELPSVLKEVFSVYHNISPRNVWSFSASLTSVP